MEHSRLDTVIARIHDLQEELEPAFDIFARRKTKRVLLHFEKRQGYFSQGRP